MDNSGVLKIGIIDILCSRWIRNIRSVYLQRLKIVSILLTVLIGLKFELVFIRKPFGFLMQLLGLEGQYSESHLVLESNSCLFSKPIRGRIRLLFLFVWIGHRQLARNQGHSIYKG